MQQRFLRAPQLRNTQNTIDDHFGERHQAHHLTLTATAATTVCPGEFRRSEDGQSMSLSIRATCRDARTEMDSAVPV